MPKEAWPLPDDSKEILRPYFSVREYDDTPSFGFVPFRLEQRTEALLLFTAADITAYTETLASSMDELAPLITGARLKSFQDGHIVPSMEMRSATEKELQKADREQRTLLFLYIDFTFLLRPIEELCPSLESYSLYLELLRLTARYFRNSGTTIAAGGNSAIVILESKRAKKGRLLIHQLLQHIRGYFSPDITFTEPYYQEKYYPSNGEIADDFLEGFQQQQ